MNRASKNEFVKYSPIYSSFGAGRKKKITDKTKTPMPAQMEPTVVFIQVHKSDPKSVLPNKNLKSLH